MKNHYMHQEALGLLIGPYEDKPKSWYPDGVPMDYASQTLTPDLDRIASILAGAIERVPAMSDCGVKEEINGPNHLHTRRRSFTGTRLRTAQRFQ